MLRVTALTTKPLWVPSTLPSSFSKGFPFWVVTLGSIPVSHLFVGVVGAAPSRVLVPVIWARVVITVVTKVVVKGLVFGGVCLQYTWIPHFNSSCFSLKYAEPVDMPF